MKLDEYLNEEEMIRIYEEENRPFEVTYLEGMRSKRGRKVFKNQKEYEKWLEKKEGDVTHLQWRFLDEETVNEAPIASKGWTDKSVDKFGETIGKDPKEDGFFAVCVKRLSGKEGFNKEKAEGFCASVKDAAYADPHWRGKGKSKEQIEKDTAGKQYK